MGNRLLVVDGDPTSLRALESDLRAAGFEVVGAASGPDALALAQTAPHLAIMDGDFAGSEGIALRARLRQQPGCANLPFLFLTSDNRSDRASGDPADLDGYLSKPVAIDSLVTRIRGALQNAHRIQPAPGAPFAGRLAETTVVDLVRVMEAKRGSGIIQLKKPPGSRASIYFRDGKVVDAEVGRLSGSSALARLFAWTDGSFDVEWKSIRRNDVIQRSSAELTLEGSRRLEEWSRLTEQFPNRETVFGVAFETLGERLAEIPDEVNGILRLCDGNRTISQVLEESPMPDGEAISILLRLRDESIIYELPRGGSGPGDSQRGAAVPEKSTKADRDWGVAASGPSTAEPAPSPQMSATNKIGDRQSSDPGARQDAPIRAASAWTRRRTAPGLGEALSTAAPGDRLRAGLDDPQTRSAAEHPAPGADDEHTKAFQFPTLSQAEAAVSSTVPAASPRGRSSAVRYVGTGPRQSDTSGMIVTASLGQVGARGSDRGDAENSRRKSARDAGSSGEETVSSHRFGSPTQRGFQTWRAGDGLDDSAAVPIEVTERESGGFRDSDPGGLFGSAKERVHVSAPSTSAESTEPRSQRSRDSSVRTVNNYADSTARITFPDDEVTADDANDELGLRSRWRGLRFLLIAVALGGVAMMVAHRFRLEPPELVDHAAGVVAGETSTQVVDWDRPARPTAAGPIVAPSHASAGVPAPTGRAEPLPGAAGKGGENEAAAAAAGSDVPPPSSLPSVATESAPQPTTPLPTAPELAQEKEESAAALSAPQTAGANAARPASAGDGADFARLLAQCQAAFRRNRMGEALAACTDATVADPRSAEALTLLAHTELNRGRLARARDLATNALAIDADIADAYVIIGGVYQDSGQHREAKVAYRRYLELAPDGRYADELRSIVNRL